MGPTSHDHNVRHTLHAMPQATPQVAADLAAEAAAERKALGDEYERAAAHETVTTMNDLETRRALAWLAENHPAQLQAAVQAVRDTFAAVTADHRPLVAQEIQMDSPLVTPERPVVICSWQRRSDGSATGSRVAAVARDQVAAELANLHRGRRHAEAWCNGVRVGAVEPDPDTGRLSWWSKD